MSINKNPLGKIPPFNNTKLQFLSLQDTSLSSAAFPSSYSSSSILQRISLNNNKIRSINANDFLFLRNSKLKKLHLDSASISMIDQNAFSTLTQLQSLSLKNNQLKSCEFIRNIPSLSSINLDGNQFTSLPQQLTTPGKIKTYSFVHNLISIVDESSPLNVWAKWNHSTIQIYLNNNSFDCCLSVWFIRFLKTSPKVVEDAKLLTCAKPSDYAGQFLIKLNPDEMNCGGDVPTKSWWTTARIIGVVVVSVVAVLIGGIIGVITVFIFKRRRSTRSDYTEIDGIDDPYNNIDTASSYGGPVFPTPAEDNDDGYSTNTYVGSTRSFPHSEAPTHTTDTGASVIDGSRADGFEVQEAALIPPV